MLAALSLLGGCANGDFGQIKPYLVRDSIHDWVGPAAIEGTGAIPSTFELTDDERALRDLAYPLIEPPYDRQRWNAIVREYGLIAQSRIQVPPVTAYADDLFGSAYRSPAARYAHLIDDIRNDATRLPQFFETATRVLDIDQRRRQSLNYVSHLSKAERTNALRRINVNRAIVEWVCESLHRRTASYQFALERLVIMTPTREAVDTERVLKHLRAEFNYYSRNAAPTWKRQKSLASSN
jgi:hypothetical protein